MSRSFWTRKYLWLFGVALLAGGCFGRFAERDGAPPTDADADSDADGDTDADADGDGDADADGDGDGDAEVDADGDAPCTPRAETQCVGDELFWVDSCGELGELSISCSAADQVCRNNSECCTSGVEASCDGDLLRSFDSCGNAEEVIHDCAEEGGSCVENQCCTLEEHRVCSGGDIHWVDSCENLGAVAESCDDGIGCTADRCVEVIPSCVHTPNCSTNRCRELFESCQCNPVETELSCGSSIVGSTAPSDDTTDLFSSYGGSCNWEMSFDLDGNEVTYRFSYSGTPSSRWVNVEVGTICGGAAQAHGLVLDGSFTPCDETVCVSSQAREPPVCDEAGASISLLTFTAYSGVEYYIVVDSPRDGEGSFTVDVTCPR